jgi:CRP/FNR family transcriptional regulator/CRP/FNR family cyclic AMP-dependent transcriptional regulator
MSTARHGAEALGSLRKIGLFSSVKDEDLERVASILIERRFPKHKTIVEEGLPGDYMYIIREGRVSVSKLSDDGREKILEFLETGDFFGEMSLLDNAPRSASVRALTDARSRWRSSRSSRDGCDRWTSRPARSPSSGSRSAPRGFCSASPGTTAAARAGSGPPCQIADMIGTSRETVTRALKGLRQEGWLEQDGKRYLVQSEES